MTSTANLKNLLLYPFKDEKSANKLLIGSLLVFANFIIPVIPFLFVIGYGAKIARRVIDGDGEVVLPEWDDWNTYFKDGVRLFIVSLVYSLPTILISIFGIGAYFIALFSMIISSSNGQESAGFFIIYMLSLFLMMFTITLAMLLAFLEGAILPVSLMHVIHSGSIKSAFQFKAWLKIYRRSFVDFLVCFIFLFGLAQLVFYAGYALYFTLILIMLIPFVYSFIGMYLIIVAMPMFAKAYRDGLSLIEDDNKTD